MGKRYTAVDGRFPAMMISAAALSSMAMSGERSMERPNILVIIADDLRDYGPGTPLGAVPTPTLDRFSREGISFTRAYANYAVCGPSRNSFLSGLRPESTGAVLNTHHSIRSFIPDVVTLPEWFRRHGYTTVGTGKIFHQDQDQESWSHFFPFPGWISGYLESEGRPSTEFGEHPEERYPDGWMVRVASEWLEENKDGKEPFLMMVGLLKPHLPFVTSRSDFDETPPDMVPRPVLDKAPAGSPGFAIHTGYELRAYDDIPEGSDPLDPGKEERLRRGYAACVRFVDRQIGILLDTLERTGVDKTTHVLILGDHGFHFGENGFWCKDSVFETSLKTYFAYRAPWNSTKKIEPESADTPLELVDLYPTLLEIAGLPEPYPLDGRSLFYPGRPDVAFSMVQRHGAVFGFSVRDARYRYTRWIDRMTGEVRAEELYDYDREPLEGRNRIGDEDYAMVRKELADRIDAHLLDSLYHPDSTEWGTPLKPPQQ